MSTSISPGLLSLDLCVTPWNWPGSDIADPTCSYAAIGLALETIRHSSPDNHSKVEAYLKGEHCLYGNNWQHVRPPIVDIHGR